MLRQFYAQCIKCSNAQILCHAHSLAVFIKCCLPTMKYNLVDLFLNIKLLFYGRLFHQTTVLSLLRVFHSVWPQYSEVQSIKWWCVGTMKIKWQFSVCPLHITNHMLDTLSACNFLHCKTSMPAIWFATPMHNSTEQQCTFSPRSKCFTQFREMHRFLTQRIYISEPMILI